MHTRNALVSHVGLEGVVELEKPGLASSSLLPASVTLQVTYACSHIVALRCVESSGTGDQAHVPCVCRQSLNRWTAGKSTHGLLTKIAHLVSGLNDAQVLDASLQKGFSERQNGR